MEKIPVVEIVKPLGKMVVEIDLDQGTYKVGFENTETVKLLLPIEIQNVFSPFHAACIINELRRRREGQSGQLSLIVPPPPKMVIELSDKIKRNPTNIQ
jgi:hypothetical protein